MLKRPAVELNAGIFQRPGPRDYLRERDYSGRQCNAGAVHAGINVHHDRQRLAAPSGRPWTAPQRSQDGPQRPSVPQTASLRAISRVIAGRDQGTSREGSRCLRRLTLRLRPAWRNKCQPRQLPSADAPHATTCAFSSAGGALCRAVWRTRPSPRCFSRASQVKHQRRRIQGSPRALLADKMPVEAFGFRHACCSQPSAYPSSTTHGEEMAVDCYRSKRHASCINFPARSSTSVGTAKVMRT